MYNPQSMDRDKKSIQNNWKKGKNMSEPHQKQNKKTLRPVSQLTKLSYISKQQSRKKLTKKWNYSKYSDQKKSKNTQFCFKKKIFFLFEITCSIRAWINQVENK